MKLNLAQPAAVRINIPLLLKIKEADVKKYKATTFTQHTQFEASLDFGPEDFDTDNDRIAALELSNLLIAETRATREHFYSIPEGLVIGRICTVISYPINEEEIRAQARAIVRDASEQHTKAEQITSTFKDWATTTSVEVIQSAEKMAKNHQKWIDILASLKAREQPAIDSENEPELIALCSEYESLASDFPNFSNALSEMLDALSKVIPEPFPNIRWEVRDGFETTTMRDNNPILRQAEPGVTWYGRAYIDICSPGYLSYKVPKLIFKLDVTGSLLEPSSTKIEFPLECLKALWNAASTIGVDTHHTCRNDVTKRIQAALSSIEKKKTVTEMLAWIKANGTDHLKQGIELDYSMKRQYREERTRQILESLSPEFSTWSISVDPSSFNLANIPTKASPSAESLKALALILPTAKGAGIGFSGDGWKISAQNDEVICIPSEQLFPDSTVTIVYKEGPLKPKRTIKRKS